LISSFSLTRASSWHRNENEEQFAREDRGRWKKNKNSDTAGLWWKWSFRIGGYSERFHFIAVRAVTVSWPSRLSGVHNTELDKVSSRDYGVVNTVAEIEGRATSWDVWSWHWCHTWFSEGNQVQTYMHARIKFHAYSWHKWITETISRKKKGDYQRFTLNPGNGGTKLHKQSTGGCVCLEPATSSQDFKVASSFWATLFIARVSTCRTQQLWGKEWMQRLYSGLGYKHLSNFSWSSFISTWLLIKV
jgi:hypothetical protein